MSMRVRVESARFPVTVSTHPGADEPIRLRLGEPKGTGGTQFVTLTREQATTIAGALNLALETTAPASEQS